MTAEKLYGILVHLHRLDTSIKLQAILEAVGTALANIASAPAQPQFQSQLAEALVSLDVSAASLKIKLSPSQLDAIRAMGGETFFDLDIAKSVRTAIQSNAMTPSVARDFVQTLVSDRSSFLGTVQATVQGLKKLGIKEYAVEKGAADASFVIPRAIFDNELGKFAKEVTYLNRLVEHYSEAVTGKAEQAQLEQLSSSTPTVALLASVPVLACIGASITWFLDAWERIERIRKSRAELIALGIDGAPVAALDDRIEATVAEVVEKSVENALSNYTGENGRRNELETGVREVTRRLFGQIERGLRVEFRTNVDKDGDPEEESQKALMSIKQMSVTLAFPEVAKEPMLLGAGELLEGSIKLSAAPKVKPAKSKKGQSASAVTSV